MTRVFLIAEAGMNHDGSLGIAERMVDVAADCGVDAVKFQLHDARAETTRDAPPPPYFGAEPRFEYFQRTAFGDAGWKRLKARCDARGIEFLCSAFSLEAVDRLDGIGVDRHKVASGELTNHPLLVRLAETGKPIILSSGMSSWQELDDAVALVRGAGSTFAVLQCTSEYPCPPERVGLNVMQEMARRYKVPVGLSDHTFGLAASLAAVALGATIIEKHFTLSRNLYGPDAALSLEPDDLRELVGYVREAEAMLDHPVDKDDLEPFREMKHVFEKSVVSVTAIPTGMQITRDMVSVKKPGDGIPARQLPDVVGRRALTDIPPDRVIGFADLDWEQT